MDTILGGFLTTMDGYITAIMKAIQMSRPVMAIDQVYSVA